MAQPQILIDEVGPLPITETITLGSTGPATLFVSGSVWTQQLNTLIGIEVLLDGEQVGTAEIWSNGTGTHRSVVPKFLPITLNKPFTGSPPTNPPTYTFTLQALNSNTISDLNDNFQVTLNA